MTKSNRRTKKNIQIENTDANPRRFYALQPWQYQLDGDRAVITAYVEASGKSETIITVHPTSGASAETLATYICTLINHDHSRGNALQEAISALELVLNDGLTFSSEQAADHALNSLKKSGL